LNIIFEELIASYLDSGVGQSCDFLSPVLSENLAINILGHKTNDTMKVAGIGQKSDFHKDANYRKDRIHWLENNTTNTSELAFFKLIDSWVLFLNQTCFTGIASYEFHYALYEEGSFYKKHLDQFSKNDSRVFSMIMYLNANWQEGDGGELVIYKENETVKIAPSLGRMVFFDSENLVHEVLPTAVPRMSITGWLKRS
jgi:SM-20-related protein